MDNNLARSSIKGWLTINPLVFIVDPPNALRGEWPSGLYSLRQVTEVKLGRVRSDFGWVTSED